jgi:hypothetical protein
MSARKIDIRPDTFDDSGNALDALSAGGQDFVIVSRQPTEGIALAEGRLRLPILPLKDTVVFPETMMPLAVGQPRSVQLIEDVLRGDKQVGLVAATNPDTELPGPGDIYRVGVLASIQKMLKAPDGTLRIIAQGIRRIEIEEFTSEAPYLWAAVLELPDVVEPGTELEALQRNLVSVYARSSPWCPICPTSSRWRRPASTIPRHSATSSRRPCVSRPRTSKGSSRRPTCRAGSAP